MTQQPSGQIQYTTSQAAQLLGIHRGTVQRICRQFGIGWLVNKSTRLLNERHIAALKNVVKLQAGNPNWTKAKKARMKK